VKRSFRKPLVLMTPKSLLRLEAATSRLSDFTSDGFHEILPGAPVPRADDVERVVLCSGKVYYDLLKYREEQKLTQTALIRVEQFYPLDENQLNEAVRAYPKARAIVWCQEEPQNMGGWTYIAPHLRRILGRDILYAGRAASASPAVGSLAVHKREQQCLVEEAFRSTGGSAC
jgi:2-oxoglutarate dehydrogenase E1 component